MGPLFLLRNGNNMGDYTTCFRHKPRLTQVLHLNPGGSATHLLSELVWNNKKGNILFDVIQVQDERDHCRNNIKLITVVYEEIAASQGPIA